MKICGFEHSQCPNPVRTRFAPAPHLLHPNPEVQVQVRPQPAPNLEVRFGVRNFLAEPAPNRTAASLIISSSDSACAISITFSILSQKLELSVSSIPRSSFGLQKSSFRHHLIIPMSQPLFVSGYPLEAGWSQLTRFADANRIPYSKHGPTGFLVTSLVHQIKQWMILRGHRDPRCYAPIAVSAERLGWAKDDPRAADGLAPFLPATHVTLSEKPKWSEKTLNSATRVKDMWIESGMQGPIGSFKTVLTLLEYVHY